MMDIINGETYTAVDDKLCFIHISILFQIPQPSFPTNPFAANGFPSIPRLPGLMSQQFNPLGLTGRLPGHMGASSDHKGDS